MITQLKSPLKKKDPAVSQRRHLRIEPLENRNLLAADISFTVEPPVVTEAGQLEGVTLADIDGDGDEDIVAVGGTAPHNVVVLLNDGRASFKDRFTIETGTSPSKDWYVNQSIAAADMDGDGDLDLLTDAGFQEFAVLFNQGIEPANDPREITFLQEAYYTFGIDWHAVTGADFDLDGDTDVAVVNTSAPPSTVASYQNDGSGLLLNPWSFDPVPWSGGRPPLSITSAQLNADNYPDLVITDGVPFSAIPLFGNGDGTFTDGVPLEVGNNPVSTAVADLDGDTDVDLVVVNRDSDNVSILLNSGNGTFSVQDFGVGNKPSSVAVVDMNGDGHLDLIVANRDSHDLSPLLNRGDGTFTQSVRISVGPKPHAVVAGNLNGDPYPDLVVLTGASDVTVLLGKATDTPGVVSLDGGGASYGQDFDYAMGYDTRSGVSLPPGWSAVVDDAEIVATTQAFPGETYQAGIYNAGFGADRSLATSNVVGQEQYGLQFVASVVGERATGVQLGFDIEAWGLDRTVTTNGEAVYRVQLQADQGEGFQTIADLGQVTTGETIAPPASAVGNELWTTDGTNVSLVADLVPGPEDAQLGSFATLNDDLYFTVGGPPTVVLKFDGLAVTRVSDEVPRGLIGRFRDVLLYVPDFLRYRDVLFLELDESGDVSQVPNPRGEPTSNAGNATIFRDELYFTHEVIVDGAWTTLWKYDGTTASPIGDVNTLDFAAACGGTYPQDLTVFGDHLYFSAYSLCPLGEDANQWKRGIWMTDGVTVSPAVDIGPDSVGRWEQTLTVFQGQLYFIANDGVTGYELWKYDGLTAALVADINPGPGDGYVTVYPYWSGSPRGFREFADELYFVADDGTSGRQLWKTDGDNTTRVTTESEASDLVVGSLDLAVYEEWLYFVAERNNSGYGLWKTDGVNVWEVFQPNTHGDFIRRRVAPSGITQQLAYPHFMVLDDGLYFVADDGASGSELWKTDGVAVEQVTDINAGPGDSVDPGPYLSIIAVGDQLFFEADDGGSANLWIDESIPGNRVHFDSGVLDVDIPAGSTLRLRFDTAGTEATPGLIFGLDNVQLDILAPGDSDGNRRFDQLDIVATLQSGKYMSGEEAAFAEGDWNGDGLFDQLDIVAALQTGNYLRGYYAAESVIPATISKSGKQTDIVIDRVYETVDEEFRVELLEWE